MHFLGWLIIIDETELL